MTGCDSVCFFSGGLGVFQWTRSTVIHTFLSAPPYTVIKESMELERSISNTATEMNLSRLKNFTSFLKSHMNWLIYFTSE